MAADTPATNALLDRLDPLTLVSIEGSIQQMTVGQVLLQSGDEEEHVYFPITAVLSLMSTMASGDSCEVALVGREGMVGLSGVLGSSESPTACVVQIGGTCLRASARAVRDLRNSDAAMREAVDCYITARLIQVAHVAACNRLHPIGGRLARWLLMLHDRVDGDRFKLPQQSIANSLGVHRPTIALELQRLHASRAIVYRHRMVTIADRPLLERLACECHVALHEEYTRLCGPLPAAAPVPALTRDAGAVAIEALRNIAGRLLVASLDAQTARERAEAADRAKDQFLAMVSHELRAPLHSILGWCAIARRPDAPPHAIDAIERNAHAQSALIDDLIDSARIDAGTLRISPREISAVGVVESAIETIRPAAEAKHVSLHLTVLDELTPLVADENRLHQVMVNVLMNSVKFSSDGGSVDTEVSARDAAIEVRVIDHGDGIAADMLPHVFERFRQGQDDFRARQGLGLGLSIARSLVELHGGTIALHSGGEGRGTTCTITLPRSATNRPATGAESARS
jgi:signal transduction histidine kinase